MKLHFNKYKEGAFSIVFIDEKKSKAYKIFKSFKYPTSERCHYTEEQFNTYRQKVFYSEEDAY